ncbi:4-hydroxybutyrate coenzyme A transferase [Aricia agestis]|uniref:4-hydroxybutyrate coenzyme A transferase n=1 Tax=Aricia agestis TaxID=91739 RepID=UPI001C207B79|nr:4-hydroxybutyrate coenzyme A transferase [Aricia agestis]
MSVIGKFVVPSATKHINKLSAALQVARSNRTYFTYTQSLSQPLDRKPETITAKAAFEKCLKSGQTVVAQGAAATPAPLLDAMTEVGKKGSMKDIKVVHMHTEKEAAYTAPDCEGIFRSCSLFMAANVRKPVAEGRSDVIPIFLQDIPKLFHRKIIQPDITLIQVSPPDQHGYCSLGTSVDCVRAALVNSKVIIAQINPHMPRTFGDAIIHISHVDYAVEDHTPLAEHGAKPGNPDEAKIGQLIADNLVEDGATLQMGIGSIPDAVLASLTNHKDLGIHSEMFSIGVIDLVKRGCVTNNMKTRHKGRIVASFLVGNRALYDFVDNNPFIEMMEVDYVNNTHIISQQPRMTAINSCMEIDITGQVCADSIGTRMYSGFGGQVDFIRGSAESLDGRGKPIIAIVSATKRGESKIVPTLKPGAGVVTTRAHINYVVTEQGIANLFGKTLRQRAYELIRIAHPDHRESLEKAAFERLKCMPAP